MPCKASITGDQRAQILRCKSSTASIGVHIKFSLLFFFHAANSSWTFAFYKNKTISSLTTQPHLWWKEGHCTPMVVRSTSHLTTKMMHVCLLYANAVLLLPMHHPSPSYSTTLSTIPFFGLFFRSFFCALSLCTFYTFPAPNINQVNLHHVRAYTTHILQDWYMDS